MTMSNNNVEFKFHAKISKLLRRKNNFMGVPNLAYAFRTNYLCFDVDDTVSEVQSRSRRPTK